MLSKVMLLKTFLVVVQFCPGIYAELVFDVSNTKQTIGGFGAQIWPADTAGEFVLENIGLRYSSLAIGPYWPSISEPPPTDGNRTSFDSYVTRNYDSNDLADKKQTWIKTEQLGITNIIDLYHIPPAWEGAQETFKWKGVNKTLKSEHYDDYAMLWGSTIKFFADNGMNITLIEVINEPDGRWIYNVSPTNYNIVLKKVRAELDYRGFNNVGIIGPATSKMVDAAAYIDALDSEGVAALHGFSTHAYDEKLDPDCGPEYFRNAYTGFHAAIGNQDPSRLKPVFITEYQCGAYIFHDVNYPDPHSSNYDYSASDTVPFAAHLYENSISLLNCGVSVPVLWQAAEQSWLDQGYGFVRRAEDGATPRPFFYALQTLIPRIPVDAKLIAPPTQRDRDIYAAAFVKCNRVVVAMVNCTASTKTKTIRLSNAESGLGILEAPAFINGQVVDKTLELTPGETSGEYNVDVSLPADSTLTIVCDVHLEKRP